MNSIGVGGRAEWAIASAMKNTARKNQNDGATDFRALLMNQTNPICWCGNTNLSIFSKDYFFCSDCDTLIARDFPQSEISRVSNDEEDFYGREYWLSHQTEGLGLQSIEHRSRTDLLDRCGDWLRTLLRFRQAPGKLLDIGCSHGAFVALTELAGYNSTGLELSPWVVEYGRKAFSARILLGPVEDQLFAAGSFEVVTLFDVMEHLQDPRKTIKECVRILSLEGILIIQTPCLPKGATFETLRESQHPFLRMMLPKEHLFLFSRSSIVRLLEEAGLMFTKFENAPFSDYDMLVVASRSELKTFGDKERLQMLGASSVGRLLDAYMTQDATIRGLNERLAQALSDANARLENVMKLDALLKESEKNRAEVHLSVEDLNRRLKAFLQKRSGLTDARETSVSGSGDDEVDGVTAPREPPIRIGIDLTPVLPGSANGGAKFAALEFVRMILNDFGKQFQLTLFLPQIAYKELRSYFSGSVDLKCTRFAVHAGGPLSHAIEEMKNQNRIRAICRANSIQVFYSPFGRFVGLPLEVAFVAQVHDLIHLDYPETLARKDRLWRHFNLLKLALRKATFQVSSEFTRNRLHIAYNVPLDRIERTYLPIHDRFSKETSPRDGAYFVYPAQAWPHKNHENLLRAYKIYQGKFGVRAWNLVLTTGYDSRSERLRSMASRLELGSKVNFLGEVEEEELNRIYRSASSLIFPSRYEGFGIPLIEAMHFGLPIICGRTGSQPEVAGDAAIYVDVEDPQDIAGAMGLLTEDKNLCEQLMAKGTRQLQRYFLKTEVRKLTRLFQKCAKAEPKAQRLRQIPIRLAILFLEFLYAVLALCLSIPSRRRLKLR